MKTRKSAQVTNNKKLKSLEKSFKAVVQINAKNSFKFLFIEKNHYFC